MLIPHSYPYLTDKDREVVIDCFEREYVGYDDEINNEIVKEIQKYVAYSHLEITPSASLALLIILKYLNIKEGDEIILSSINCWSVYNTICMEKATPIISDVRSVIDFRASFSSINNKITNRTKIIIVTHMYGVIMEAKIIKELKENYPNIIIIEDFATSLYSQHNLKLGKYSDFGIGSFGSTKPLTGGIGGVLCSHQKILEINYGKYEKNFIPFNVKISRLNQVLLLNQLQKFKEYQKMKKEITSFYSKYVTLFSSEKTSDLFRAITFDSPSLLIAYLDRFDIKLDIRESVQPNLIKELNIENQSNAYCLKKYFSLPLNIKAYRVFKEKDLL